ncbi:MAG: hypothetical protein PHD81_00570 [Candidatus Nanoarchaeia archaeon]|nr:hypothetical protein [Candidatus Nanoarchaeia archaeon]MDD5587583.1 hypothetical protein [Candidatus Nanoarchaeia archaeon]
MSLITKIEQSLIEKHLLYNSARGSGNGEEVQIVHFNVFPQVGLYNLYNLHCFFNYVRKDLEPTTEKDFDIEEGKLILGIMNFQEKLGTLKEVTTKISSIKLKSNDFIHFYPRLKTLERPVKTSEQKNILSFLSIDLYPSKLIYADLFSGRKKEITVNDLKKYESEELTRFMEGLHISKKEAKQMLREQIAFLGINL